MSATDELRRLLDERGVEYKVSVENGTGFEHVTWHPNKLSQWTWNEEFGAGWLAGWQQGVTPEQAIAATLGHESYGKDAEQDKRAKPDERESYDQLKAKYDELCELTREMWTFTQLVDVCGRLSNGSAWNAAEFGKRMRELGVIE